MKTSFILLLSILAGAAFATNPDEAFENLIDAVYEGDSQVILESLSTETVAMFDMVLVMVKSQPEEAAIELSETLGVEITVDELLEWTPSDFIDAFILSPEFVSELPPREDFEVSGFEVDGDNSIVFITLAGETEILEVSMVKDGSSWKLAQDVLESFVM